MKSGVMLATTEAGLESLRLGFAAWQVAARLGPAAARRMMESATWDPAKTMVAWYGDHPVFRYVNADMVRAMVEREDRTFLEDTMERESPTLRDLQDAEVLRQPVGEEPVCDAGCLYDFANGRWVRLGPRCRLGHLNGDGSAPNLNDYTVPMQSFGR